MRSRTSARIIVPLLWVVWLTGCGGVRLYSEARDEQGKAAKEAWATVDLNAVIATERSNLQKLLDLELETQDQLAAGIRDHELRYLVSAPSLREGLVNPVNARFKELVGSRAEFDASVVARQKIRKAQRADDVLLEDFAVKKVKPPECSRVETSEKLQATLDSFSLTDPVDRAEMGEILRRWQKHCAEKNLDVVKAVFEPLTGAMMEAFEQYRADLQALESIRAQSAAQQDKYKTALKNYEEAVKNSTPGDSATADVQEGAKKLRAEIEALVSLGDAFSVSFLSEQRLDAIENFLGAVTEAKPGEPLPDDISDAAAALIIVPKLLDDARASLADARKPLAMPLLLRRNHEQLKLEGAKREIAIREAMIRISREHMEVIFVEAAQLALAADELAQDKPKVIQWHDKPVLTAFAKANTLEKEALYSATARYLDAIRRLDAKRYKLQYQRIAASHELSLAYSEVNARQWQSLIGITVDQLAAFGAGGIKSEQIISLINAAGVLWIGNGVNE